MDCRVSKLLESIDTHVGGVNWSLNRICRELRLEISPAYAAQLFKRHVGLGVREYAIMRRLQQAVQRLAETDLPVKVIADQLGYRQSSDFTRFFREHCLQTPTKSRRRTAEVLACLKTSTN
jgi:AraC-like DNA-binding protein